MSINLMRASVLSILISSMMYFCACEKPPPVSMDTDKNASINQQPTHKVKQDAKETGVSVTSNTTITPLNKQPEPRGGQPIIDKIKVTLRSGLEEKNIITIDPNGDSPQPEIEVKSLYTAEITCIARSLKGEPLQYDWQATGGKIFGKGEKITWLAPGAPINYRITVAVTDSSGAASTRVNISVRCCY